MVSRFLGVNLGMGLVLRAVMVEARYKDWVAIE